MGADGLGSQDAAACRVFGHAAPLLAAAPPPCEEPEHLLCPITYSLLRDPVVVAASGNTYERAAILAHWKRRGVAHDPLSNEELESDALVTNWGKRREVQAYLAVCGPGYIPEGWDSREMPAPPVACELQGGATPCLRSPQYRWHHQLHGFFEDEDEDEWEAPRRQLRGLVVIFPSFIVFQSWMVMGGWLCWWRSGGHLRSAKGLVGLSHCLWTLGLSSILGLWKPISCELRWEYIMAMLTGVVHGLLTKTGCPKLPT
uniref:RING-type E3 ubiquitin transferase n=1 Tax=Alexandrium catenella TaxID=2925 RepID=A0A7S1SBN1_ALECA